MKTGCCGGVPLEMAGTSTRSRAKTMSENMGERTMVSVFLKNSAVALALSALLAGSSAALADTGGLQVSKDTGPSSSRCDSFDKASAVWAACVGNARAAMPNDELFYAGYWLAKSGKYEEALTYLSRADRQDERVLTYIGFATRKLGRVDAALGFYAKALALNPNYSVARAYLGEAFLTKGKPERARGELSEIAERCGTTCAEYADLAGRIRAYEADAAKKG
jgi:tetratricopeptide (TPR) repeat protein